MKKIIILIAILLVMLPVFANNENNSAKLDSLLKMQKKINIAISELHTEQKNNPLKNKTFGIEFNPFYPLIEGNTIISGSFSYFIPTKGIELAFPVYSLNDYDPKDIDVFSIDSHFRFFLRNTMNGFYISAHTRYAHVEGTAEIGDFWGIGQVDEVKWKEDRFGIGFGIGYRIFSYKSFYWGTSLSFGRYLSKDLDDINEFTGFKNLNYLNKYYLDFELLKFGFSF